MKKFQNCKEDKNKKIKKSVIPENIDILDKSKNNNNITSKTKDIIEIKDILFNIEILNNLKYILYNNRYFILASKTQQSIDQSIITYYCKNRRKNKHKKGLFCYSIIKSIHIDINKEHNIKSNTLFEEIIKIEFNT